MAKLNEDIEMVIAEDTLISDVQFCIHNILERKDISRSELARRLGVSDAYVSQIFRDGTRNLTLRSVARIFFALGENPTISCHALEGEYRRVTYGADAGLKRPSVKEDIRWTLSNTLDLLRETFAGSSVTVKAECNDNWIEAECDAA